MSPHIQCVSTRRTPWRNWSTAALPGLEDPRINKIFLSTDDPVLFQNQPVTIQIVGRPFEDEELLASAGVVDEVLNGGRLPN